MTSGCLILLVIIIPRDFIANDSVVNSSGKLRDDELKKYEAKKTNFGPHMLKKRELKN